MNRRNFLSAILATLAAIIAFPRYVFRLAKGRKQAYSVSIPYDSGGLGEIGLMVASTLTPSARLDVDSVMLHDGITYLEFTIDDIDVPPTRGTVSFEVND